MEARHSLSDPFDDIDLSTAERLLLSGLDHQNDKVPREALTRLRHHRIALLSGDENLTKMKVPAVRMSWLQLTGFAGSACLAIALVAMISLPSSSLLHEPAISNVAVEPAFETLPSYVSGPQDVALDAFMLLSDIEPADWELIENVEFAWWLSEVDAEWEQSDYAG